MPVEALRLPPETVELLWPLGLQRIEQLESLPRAELALRFGSELLRRWDQATGRAAEPIRAVPWEAEFQQRLALEYPTAQREALEMILERLIRQIAGEMLRRGRGALRMDCRLETTPAAPVSLSIGLYEASASPQHLLGLLRMRLERVKLSSPVSAVAVEATLTAPLVQRQEDLFPHRRQRQHRPRLFEPIPETAGTPETTGRGKPLRSFQDRFFALLVDRLAGRLGAQSVLRVRLASDAQPERAWQGDPMTSAAATKSRQRHGGAAPGRVNSRGKNANAAGAGSPGTEKGRRAGWSATANEGPPRPLRLMRRPLPLAVISTVPDGPPSSFSLRGGMHRVAHWWGPERIETGWWRGPTVARDYYRVETAAGYRYWLFRCLRDGKWFLQGMFE